MKDLAPALQRAAGYLRPHRDELVECWMASLATLDPPPADDVHGFCQHTVEALLGRLGDGHVQAFLEEEAQAAAGAARRGESFQPLAAALRSFDRCCARFLVTACEDPAALADSLLALDELADRRLEALLSAQEDESARRLIEAQEQAARAQEHAHDLERLNEALRRAEARSERRAEQVALLALVARSIAGVLHPETLLQEAATAIQARTHHRYVGVVVLDDEGVLVGRWAGRPGVGRRRSGRAQGPAGGLIGRALRKRAPQVVTDVLKDPDYFPDVEGTRSEMVVPLLEQGEAIGAIDFQSDRVDAFDLDAVAAGEAIAEFVVIGLHNARFVEELRAQARQSPEA